MFKLDCIAALASLAELDRALGNDELARGEFAYVARPLAVPVTASR